MRISFDMDGVLADMDSALAALAEQEFGVSAGAGGRAKPEKVEGPAPPVESGETLTKNASQAPAIRSGAGSTPGVSNMSSGELPSAVMAQLSARQQTRLWQRVRETRNFWESLNEYEPGTVRQLQKLAHQLRWDVLFVTQRPATAGRTAQLQTQHWLRQHGFEYPAVYTTQGSRGRIGAALTLDAHVDDRLENCVDVATDSRTWPILVWRDESSFARISTGAARLGIASVRTVGEALARIDQADRASADQQDEALLLGRLKRAFER